MSVGGGGGDCGSEGVLSPCWEREGRQDGEIVEWSYSGTPSVPSSGLNKAHKNPTQAMK